MIAHAAARSRDRFWACPISRRWTDRDSHCAALFSGLDRVNGGAHAAFISCENPATSNIKHFITARRLSCWAERPTCISQEKIRPKAIYGECGDYKKSVHHEPCVCVKIVCSCMYLSAFQPPPSAPPSVNNESCCWISKQQSLSRWTEPRVCLIKLNVPIMSDINAF